MTLPQIRAVPDDTGALSAASLMTAPVPAVSSTDSFKAAVVEESKKIFAAESVRQSQILALYAEYQRRYNSAFESNDYTGDGTFEELHFAAIEDGWSVDQLKQVLDGIVAQHRMQPAGGEYPLSNNARM